MLEGVKPSRAIARTPSFASFLAGELLPGEAVDDSELATFIPGAIAVAVAVAVYGHPTSTVPMGGPGDPGAVVDAGVQGLTAVRRVLLGNDDAEPSDERVRGIQVAQLLDRALTGVPVPDGEVGEAPG
ncbi:hypothetical protein ABIA35_003421 [Catenulispora sp. MAP12-49]